MTYLESRIYNQMHCTPEQCNVKLKNSHGALIDVPIFTSDIHDNIKIIMYDLHRNIIEVENDEKHQQDVDGVLHGATAYQVRYNPDWLAAHPDSPKYHTGAGEKTRPFFPPNLLEKYEKGEYIPTLYLTEGYIKAFCAYLHGWPIVGLTSVTCYAEKDTKRLHADILALIRKCGVKNVVMIYDGDCLDISEKDLANGDETTRRPNMFLSSAVAIKNLLSGVDGVEFWFMHVIRNTKNDPKGLDDLLEASAGKEADLLKDANELGSVGTTGVGRYFFRLNMTTNSNRLRAHFHFLSADDFYQFWINTIKTQTFKYFGSVYGIDEDGKLKLELPSGLTKYFRIGIGYFRLINQRNEATGEQLERLVQWQKGCILDDYKDKIKNPIEKITKLDGFIYHPDNTSYSRIIDNKWNYYEAIRFDPVPGRCTNIMTFLNHIFEEQIDMGLDYIQLIYQQPRQMLPILCLVSKERHTGKTTFCNFMADVLGDNALVVGNGAFTGNFNGYMAGKLLIACDETSLSDKQEVTEKIKRMSTEKNTMIEYKGLDAQPIPNFSKFILCSNKERDFIYTDKEEVRFWIRKVRPLTLVDPDLEKKMHDEIPAFLYYLNSRKLTTERKTRAWFDFDLLKTKALEELQAQQLPVVVKEVLFWLKDIFLSSDAKELKFSINNIIQANDYLRSCNKAPSQIRRALEDYFDIQIERGRYDTPSKTVGFDGNEIWTMDHRSGNYYTFKREKVLTDNDKK